MNGDVFISDTEKYQGKFNLLYLIEFVRKLEEIGLYYFLF